jgi:hypothetical protein
MPVRGQTALHLPHSLQVKGFWSMSRAFFAIFEQDFAKFPAESMLPNATIEQKSENWPNLIAFGVRKSTLTSPESA